jgi:hypothetical protein
MLRVSIYPATAAAEKAPYIKSGGPSNAAPSQDRFISNEPEGDTHTLAPASPTRAPSGSWSATPKKHPRDLSQIFSSHGSDQSKNQTLPSSPSPSRSSSSTPRRAKMLSRSATFPSREPNASMRRSISADPSPILSPIPRSRTSVVQKTASWPMLSPSPSKSDAPPQRAGEGQNDTVLDAPVPRPTLRTYSASRSFLVTVPLSPTTSRGESSLRNDDLESQDAIQHESYADLRKKYRVDLSSDDDMDTGISGPVDLKTIGELRDKGENRRFLDDMGYLLEGLAPRMSIAVKRLRYTSHFILLRSLNAYCVVPSSL